LTDLGPGIAFDINSSGEVVGQSANNPFLWTPATGMQDLGSLGPGWGPGYARSIDDQGDVVGYFYRQFGANLPANTAFYWTPSDGMRNIGQPPGYASSLAVGIDNQGNVTVWATTSSGANDTFRWRPDSGWTFVAPGIPEAANHAGFIA